jgi:polyvinyl alcohol dehydrogenase (cytochrome)
MKRFVAVLLALIWVSAAGRSWAADGSDWTTYLHDPSRDNAVQDGATFTGTTAQLHETWSFSTKAGLAASPVLAKGFVYVPSWDGNVYAVNLSTHALVWQRFLGTATTWEGKTGVSNPPAFASDIGPNGTILVGGGGRQVATDSHLYFYALDATTGAILWRTAIGNAAADALFDSPLYTNGHVYIGTADSGPKGFRPAYLYELDATTGQVLHKVSMSGKAGGGGAIWGSIAFDSATNRIFVPTGDGDKPYSQPLAEGFVAVDATTLRVVDHWHIPAAKQLNDDDFGTSATVFSGGAALNLVGGATKFDGRYYAFDVRHLAKGPVWTQRISATGSLSPFDISSSAYASGAEYPDGSALYVAGSDVKMGGKTAPAALYALNPANGHVIWRVACGGAVLGAVTVYDNTVIVPIGALDNSPGGIEVRSATNGHLLASFPMTAPVFAAPVVADGTIYVGTMDGVFHALTISP